MLDKVKTSDLEALLADVKSQATLLPNTRLIEKIEKELTSRDLDRKATEDLEEQLFPVS